MRSTKKRFVCVTFLYFFCLSLIHGAPNDLPSEETLKQLKLIEESINASTDPCDDFYDYACGNWEIHHKSYTQTAMYTILFYYFDFKVSDLISELVPYPQEVPQHNQTFADKLTAFYRSCDGRGVTRKYFEYVKPSDKIEWPLVNEYESKEEQNYDNFDLFALLGKLYSFGMNNVLIDRNIERLENGTLFIKLTLDLLDPHEDRGSHIKDMLATIGFKKNSEELNLYDEEILNTTEYWYSMRYEYRYSDYNEDIMTLEQIKVTYPKLFRFLENMLPNHIRPDDLIQITNLAYMENLLAQQWQTEDLRKMLNYLMSEFFKFLSYEATLDCEKSLNRYMHLAVNFLFYEKYLKPQEPELSEVFDNLLKKISKQVYALVDENKLKFSDNMIKAIKDKLDRLYASKGNLPENVNSEMVEQFFSDVPDLERYNYVPNVLHILKHHFRKSFDCPQHMECIDAIGPVTVNIAENDLMVVPFESLTPPMFHYKFDPLFAVSLMGTLLGHEYAHSIDTSSLRSENIFYGLHEDFNNHPELNEAIECMQDQENTDDLRERVADFFGARAAYHLYAKEYNTQPSFSTKPWQQLFFLNMAQYFCQADGVSSIRHDPAAVRMRQIAQNMEEFAEAFQCPVGSNMNPRKKCRFY